MTTPNAPLPVLRGSTPWIVALAAAWAIGAGATRVAPPSDARWAAALLDEKLRRAAQRPAAGVLVVGGSGTHFGFDCAAFEERAHARCFNLGTHAGLGVATLVRAAEQAAREGDVVILRLEHAIAAEPYAEGELSDSVRAMTGLALVDGVDVERDIARVLRAGSPGLRAFVRGLAWQAVGPRATAYGLEIDARGDPRAAPDGPAGSRDTTPLSPSAAVTRVLEAARERLRARGVVLLFDVPLAQVAGPHAHHDEAARAIAALSRIAPVLSDAGASLSADASDFTDSPYHLSPRARARVSTALAERLLSLPEAVRLP